MADKLLSCVMFKTSISAQLHDFPPPFSVVQSFWGQTFLRYIVWASDPCSPLFSIKLGTTIVSLGSLILFMGQY